MARERLLEGLLSPRPEDVVAIIGPAGYGKTTLLAQWQARERRPVAWLTVDKADADPQVLLAYLATAIDRAIGLPPDVRTIFGEAGSPALTAAVPRLASALHRRDDRLLVIVDDVHVIAATLGLDALAMFIGYAPLHVTVAVTGRNDAGLPLARWRAAGRLYELAAHDLALDPVESQRAIALLDETVDDTGGQILHEATEGWPAALYLAVRARRASSGRPPPAGAAAVDVRSDIGAFFDAELLSGKDDRTRGFLMQTAILERLTAGLCDAVIDGTGSGQILQRLAATDRFVTPVDAEGRWYRYHALLRDHLLLALERDGADTALLHRRAADWFAANDMVPASIDHRLAAGDPDAAATQFSAIALTMLRDGRISTFDRWLGQLGEAQLLGHPSLAATGAIGHLLRGHLAAAERLAGLMERAKAVEATGTATESGEATVALARALMAPDGVARALGDARAAVEIVPEASPWRPVALLVLGCLLAITDDPDGADEALQSAASSAAAQGAGRSGVISMAVRAVIAMKRDAWLTAHELAGRAVGLTTTYGYYGEVADALAHAVAAHSATRRGDLTGARQELARFQASSMALTAAAPWLSVLALLEACRSYLALSDPAGARNLLRHAEDIVLRRPDLGRLSDAVATLRRQLRTLPPGLAGASTLTPAEIRVLLLLPTYLSVREIAARLFVSPNTVRTQVQSIFGKLGATSRAEAVERAVAAGLLEPLPILAEGAITTTG